MIMPADRLTTLEIRAAEQERTIEELSGQIAEQWTVIERMQRKLDALTDRFLALEEQAVEIVSLGPLMPSSCCVNMASECGVCTAARRW